MEIFAQPSCGPRFLLIEENGVKGLALSDAARQAGVSVAAPYRHFKDKEALLAEIAAEGFGLFRDALARATQSDPKDKVRRLVEMGVAYVDFALEHRSHFKVMWEGGISKEKYLEVARTAYEAYLLLAGAAQDLLPRCASRAATSARCECVEPGSRFRHTEHWSVNSR